MLCIFSNSRIIGNILACLKNNSYLCIAKVYLESLVAPICTIKKIKSCPICLQLGHVPFYGGLQLWLDTRRLVSSHNCHQGR